MTVISSVAVARPAAALRRPRDMVFAGVAQGLADHLGWRPGAVRAMFVATAPMWGAGALLYAWLWAFTPLREGDAHTARRAPVAWLLLTASGIATLTALTQARDTISWGYVSGVLSSAIAVGVLTAIGAALWSGLADRADPVRGGAHQVLAVRIVATAVLAVLLFQSLVMGGSRNHAVLALLFSCAVLLGIALVWSPPLFTRYRELQSARVKAIRDEHRAEMAAHLHDSVLQTLALIQNRAGASSEAGRLARAQERELRAWLYDGDTPADSDLATDLRDYGAALELDYEVAMTVVSAGTSTERASGEVAAAAREAMLNAARHAGGDVSVYIEGSAGPAGAGAVDVYVRDRGPGFDPQAVPEDRLGVRESIVGRMRRIGGFATVGAGVGGEGTQVHIRYPAASSSVRGTTSGGARA